MELSSRESSSMKSLKGAQTALWLRDLGSRVSIVNFAIGGAYGNGEEIKKTADKVIAFGRQTWPHQMVKMMVAEQVYRIDTLLKGHPYHK